MRSKALAAAVHGTIRHHTVSPVRAGKGANLHGTYTKRENRFGPRHWDSAFTVRGLVRLDVLEKWPSRLCRRKERSVIAARRSGYTSVRQPSGSPTQAQRSALPTVTSGSGRGGSATQPPAIPTRPDSRRSSNPAWCRRHGQGALPTAGARQAPPGVFDLLAEDRRVHVPLKVPELQ